MSLSDWMLNVSLKSFVVMAIVTLMALLFHRSSAAVRHRIWTLGLCGTLGIPLLTCLLPSYRVNVLTPKPVAVVATITSADPIVPTTEVGESLAADMASPLSSEQISDETFADVASPPNLVHQRSVAPAMVSPMPTANQTPIKNHPWWIALYLIGAGILFANCLRHWIQTQRWISQAQPIADQRVLASFANICQEWTDSDSSPLLSNVALLHREDLSMPCAAGIFRPAVLLPTDCLEWPEERLKSVLLHELAHVVRRDMLTQSIAEICRSLYWFNPFVWLAVARLHVEREQACDDHVLRSGVVASDYAELLLNVARDYRHSQRAIGLAMARPNDLQQRIGSLLDATRSRIAVNRSIAIGVGCSRAGSSDPDGISAGLLLEKNGVRVPMRVFG